MTIVHRLIVVHAMLAAFPVMLRFVPQSSWALTIIYAVGAIHWSQVMLLALYAGMFHGNSVYKMALSMIGLFYIAFWQMAAFQQRVDSGYSFVGAYLNYVLLDIVAWGLLSLVLTIGSACVGKIRRLERPQHIPDHSRAQFTLLTLLLGLSLSAVVFGFIRAARENADPGTPGTLLPAHGLMLSAFATNVVLAAWATLGLRLVVGKLLMAFPVCVSLGLALGLATGHEKSPYLLANDCLITVVPTAMVVVTLLRLRRHGFRCVRKALAPES